MVTIIRYILLTALRDWLFAALLGFLFFAAMVAYTMGGTSLIETQAMQLAFAAAAMRVILVVGVIVFVCFHVRGAFDSKEMDIFLSRPITRTGVLGAYWLGFAALCVVLVLPAALLLALQGMLQVEGFFMWVASLLGELIVVATLALSFSFTGKSAVTSVLASLSIYIALRMEGFLFAEAGLKHIDSWSLALLPRLDLAARSEWLVYGVQHAQAVGINALLVAGYLVAIFCWTARDFSRREHDA